MTNGEVIQLYEGILKLEEEKELRLPIFVGYAIAKNKVMLQAEVNIILELRKKIIMKYSKDGEEEVIIPKEKVDACNKEIAELWSMENGIELIMIPITAFEDLQFTLEEMKTLQNMIKLDAG